METIVILFAVLNIALMSFFYFRILSALRSQKFTDEFRQLEDSLQSRLRRDLIDETDRTRSDILNSSKGIREEVNSTLRGMSESQNKQLGSMLMQWHNLNSTTEARMKEVQATVEHKLDKIHSSNSERLEAMRATVEEKLQGTLERRLGESFKIVGDRLEQVQRGLGEMQNLATGVGDLKRVLTNVKTRGTWGEVQLSMLLEQVLTPDQYEANSKLGRRGNEIVEFAVKLPGRDDEGANVFLPIDSKFPQEQYQRLLLAQDTGDTDGLAVARRELELAVKVAGKDIRDKYIHPPTTTDFGIMFLPTEGLFAEILRIPGIVEKLQNDYRVVVSGPTTLAALLNSLQMGFKTLAIQKRSGEVWKILGSVKSEFGKFGDLLDGVQKTLQTAANKLDDASKKTRTIETKLRNVEVSKEIEASLAIEAAKEFVNFDQ